ncbi:hypothetical protein [Streptomyces sp. NPDC002855]|uniref:hypothetical protein n=1 Tax=Streptomyces sp. NPDC002855 TaxID=3154437 RepID=UPI0033246FE1
MAHPAYFDTEEREETAKAGRELVDTLEDLGITELDDMNIVEPCPDPHCQHSRATALNLGNYSADTIRAVVAKLRALARSQ